jgi:hypothetical protein
MLTVRPFYLHDRVFWGIALARMHCVVHTSGWTHWACGGGRSSRPGFRVTSEVILGNRSDMLEIEGRDRARSMLLSSTFALHEGRVF